ncbi:unnamed protein product [Clavelina lepadiformis]|uniref:Uncharacterized protein n=1 Tax=Clavelina lepadiformis TaxID=159417 RepID=A0ABP0FRN2_CLALP
MRRGNFVPHLWNDLAPSMSINTIKDLRMAPSGWCIGGGNQKMANLITEQLDAVHEDHDVAFPRIHVDEDIDDTRSNASTPSCSSTITQLSSPSFSSGTPKQMGSTMLTPFPIVKFQRPPVAVKKGLIYYSDLPLLR